ncbi:mitotic spindle assembly checkpoint protein MAD2B [Cydia fagiglandana]|uniref:mitotic spindle assembly checkpoint protein MAD2B n=1 Tax=Cydia fagiglandana TaxID=1458189 RepID=UPI002FEE47E7
MTDNCFVDITIEFLAVAFHNILYYASVYPKSVFETRKKYSVVVYRCIHPEVNQYLDLSLKNIAECLKSEQLRRAEFSVTDESYKPVINFVFDFEKQKQSDENSDAYLIQAEQNLRAFCLNLVSNSEKFLVPDDCSFSIFIHTNESNAVALANNPELEDFPFVVVEGATEEINNIIPLRRFNVRCYNIDTYVEIK